MKKGLIFGTVISLMGGFSPIYSQQTQRGGASIFGLLLPLLLLFAIFYFLLILPQQRQEKKRKAMLSKIKKGDRVVTTGGMIGTIVKVEEGVVTLKIAQNTNVKVEKGAIKGVLSSAEVRSSE